MAQTILMVESRPKSEEDAAAYHAWYDDVHIPELLSLDGFVSAQRYAGEEGASFLAIYEIDTDIATAKAAMVAAQSEGRMTAPVGVSLDPPPSVRYFTVRG